MVFGEDEKIKIRREINRKNVLPGTEPVKTVPSRYALGWGKETTATTTFPMQSSIIVNVSTPFFSFSPT